jgi:hypothetical protein
LSRAYTLLSVTGCFFYLQQETPSQSSSARQRPVLQHFRSEELTWLVNREQEVCGYFFPDIAMDHDTGQTLKFIVLGVYPASLGYGSLHNDCDVLWVMCIVPSDDGVYEQRGLGVVLEGSEQRSCEPGMRFETLVLG